MTPLPRWTAAAVALMALPLPSPSPSPSPSPRATTAPRPVADSVERVLARREEEQKAPCREALAEGVPCFPVSTPLYGPTFSVRDSLRDLGRSGRSPSRPPTQEELARFRPGPAGPVSTLASIDPGCAGKSILKALKGKNDVYYLYRVRDVHGERAVLQDRRLDAASFQGAVEFLGRFDGECEALAAYRKEQRK